MAGESISAIAGLLTTLAGTAAQFQGASELGGAANDITDIGQQEALNTLQQASASSRALHQRAYAALFDTSTLNALVASNIRSSTRTEAQAGGLISASAAGGGVEQVGSPLLARLEASIEVGRSIGAQQIRQIYGAKRLQFEVEQNLSRATDITSNAQQEAEATLRLRNQQAATIQRRQLRTVLAGIDTLTNPQTIRNIKPLIQSFKGADYSASELG